MRIAVYHVRYAPTGEVFVKTFDPAQHEDINEFGAPQNIALELVNLWNRQNGISGFTYWIE
jgi:hypothetical protein